MQNQDIIIASLEWIKESQLKGKTTTGDELQDYLIKKKLIASNDSPVHQYVHKLHTQITDSTYQTQPGYMKLDSYLALLDYEELKQARLDSREARRDARNAIYVAIALGIIQSIWG